MRTHLIAAIGWRSGDTYSSFYEVDRRRHHLGEDQPDRRHQPQGHRQRVVRYSGDGSKLYVMNRAPSLLNKAVGTVNSYLDGIYVSTSGTVAGPCTQDRRRSTKLANSGSALKQSIGGEGYGPASRAGTTSSSSSTRADPNHVYRRPRGGLRDRRTAAPSWTTRRAVLELLLRVLGARLRLPAQWDRRTAARRPPTLTSTRRRSARSTARRTSSSATTAASTAGRSTAGVNSERQRDRLDEPQRRHHATRSSTTRSTSGTPNAAYPRTPAGRPARSSAAACRTTAARSTGSARTKMGSNFGGDGTATSSSTRTTAATSCRSTWSSRSTVTQTCAHPIRRRTRTRSSTCQPVDDLRCRAAGHQCPVHRAVRGR